MKHLLFLIASILLSVAAFSQSAIVPLDASGSGVAGGNGTGKIVSSAWSVTGTPPANVSFTDASGNTGTNQGLATYVKITKAGTYNFQIDVTDDKGNKASGTIQVIAYDMQRIVIKIVQPVIEVYLK